MPTDGSRRRRGLPVECNISKLITGDAVSPKSGFPVIDQRFFPRFRDRQTRGQNRLLKDSPGRKRDDTRSEPSPGRQDQGPERASVQQFQRRKSGGGHGQFNLRSSNETIRPNKEVVRVVSANRDRRRSAPPILREVNAIQAR